MGISTLAFYNTGGNASGKIVFDVSFIIINGFITYASAIGLSAITSQNKTASGGPIRFGATTTSSGNKEFFTQWW